MKKQKNLNLNISDKVKNWINSIDGDYTHQVDNPEDFLRFDLTEGICLFQKQVEAWIKEIPIDAVIHYPNSSRSNQQELLAKWLQTKKDNIAVGSGSDELIEILAQIFLNPEDEVVTVAPSFFRFSEASIKAGAKVQTLNMSIKDGFEWTPSIINSFLKKVRRKKVKIVWMANPNNPTGVTIPSKVLNEAIKSGKIIILDQVLNGFTKELRQSMKLIHNNKNVIVLSGFSKTFGLPGLRLGFAVASPQIAKIIRDWRLPFSSSTISMFLMEKFLTSLIKNEIDIPKDNGVTKKRQWLEQEILKIKNIETASHSQTNILLLKPHNKVDLFLELKKSKILVTDMNNLDGIKNLGLVRIAIRTQKENEELVKVLKRIGD